MGGLGLQKMDLSSVDRKAGCRDWTEGSGSWAGWKGPVEPLADPESGAGWRSRESRIEAIDAMSSVRPRVWVEDASSRYRARTAD